MKKFFKCGKYNIELGKKIYVMGILNITPDSFSDGGKWNNPESALKRALEMVECGVDFIDIGAQSTRPGYIEIPPKEELKRLLPFLKIIQDKINIPLSIDTYFPEVAETALKYGINIINDVNGFENEKMYEIASKSDCGCIIMHNKSDGIKKFFESSLEKAKSYNISPDRICFDPGIGFGKTYEMNLRLLKNCNDMRIEDCAYLVGASRKRVIGMSCGNPPFEERMAGSISAHIIAAINGADILRVHDFKETIQAVKVAQAILRS